MKKEVYVKRKGLQSEIRRWDFQTMMQESTQYGMIFAMIQFQALEIENLPLTDAEVKRNVNLYFHSP
jgi:hypothetical protein